MDLVNWLTHAANATRLDAQIALNATDATISVIITSVRRWERGAPERCPNCGSYQIVADFRKELMEAGDEDPYVTLCEVCGWEEKKKEPRKTTEKR